MKFVRLSFLCLFRVEGDEGDEEDEERDALATRNDAASIRSVYLNTNCASICQLLYVVI